MANYSFREDLSEGKEGEDFVINHLKKLGGELISKNDDNRYDVIIRRKGKNIKYEIKTDLFCKPTWDTGNIFVEVQCRGKKSGIMVSEAEWFVTYFINLNEIWYIRKNKLLDIIEKYKQNFIFKDNAGDPASETKGWMVPRYKFTKDFLVYNSNTLQRIQP